MDTMYIAKGRENTKYLCVVPDQVASLSINRLLVILVMCLK